MSNSCHSFPPLLWTTSIYHRALHVTCWASCHALPLAVATRCCWDYCSTHCDVMSKQEVQKSSKYIQTYPDPGRHCLHWHSSQQEGLSTWSTTQHELIWTMQSMGWYVFVQAVSSCLVVSGGVWANHQPNSGCKAFITSFSSDLPSSALKPMSVSVLSFQ